MLSRLMKRIGNSSISLIGGLLLIGFAFVYACGQIPDAPEAESAVGITAPVGGYEEGSWIPSLGGSTVYAAQSGSYIKIGRLVRASFFVNVSTIGTGSTSSISGLPFTSASVGNQSNTICSVRVTGSVTAISSIIGYIAFNSTSVELLSIIGSATSFSSNAIFGNGMNVMGSCTYYTN